MTDTLRARPVRRETPAMARSGRFHRPIVIELGAHSVKVKLKGTRTWYEVSYNQIWNRGAQNAVEDRRRAKAESRKR